MLHFTVKTSQETDSLIQAYIHQHVWMLFTLLAISMGDVVYSQDLAGPGLLDHEYMGLAAQLQTKAISIATHCLQQVPDDEEGKIVQLNLSAPNCIKDFLDLPGDPGQSGLTL